MLKSKPNNILSIDWITVLLYVILVIIGWFNIYAATYNEDHNSIFDMTQKYGKQLIWIIAAVCIIIAILLIDSRFFMYFSYPIYLFVIFVLIAVLFIGTEINNSKSWISIGEMSIQPAEFAKFATILAVSNYLSQYGIKLMSFKSLLITIALILIPVALIFLQNDTGTSVVFVSLIFILYREGLPSTILLIFASIIVLFILSLTTPFHIVLLIVLTGAYIYLLIHNKFKKIFILFGMISTLAISIIFLVRYLANLSFSPTIIFITYLILLIPFIFVYLLNIKQSSPAVTYCVALLLIIFSYSTGYIYDNVLQPHQRNRIDLVLGSDNDPMGTGYNVNQSKIAVGSGGVFGKGFLNGTQTKYDFVPEQSTDFIFCTIGEEQGFVGSTAVIILFTAFLLRLIVLAERQPLKFSRLYGYGVISIFFAHIFINIGMVIGIAPVIGIPLPFFSYGGSSLWAFTILLFIFIRLDAARELHVNT